MLKNQTLKRRFGGVNPERFKKLRRARKPVVLKQNSDV